MEMKALNCLTREEKKHILTKYEEGKSYSEIAGIVRRLKSIVYHVISRFKADKTKPRTGRPSMTTKREDRMIIKMSLKDRFDKSTSISRSISRKTVSRRLNKGKLMARISCHKPLIPKENQKIHLDFATGHIVWTEEQWNVVHFSDEFKFDFFRSDGKSFVRCKNGEPLSPQCDKKIVKFGGVA